MASTGPATLRRYLREILIPAYYAAPDHSELEEMLDVEMQLVAEALGLNLDDELHAQCGLGLSGYEVEAAFADIGLAAARGAR